MNKTETYRTFLQEQGFTPTTHEGLLAFRFEGGNYLLFPEEADAQFFRVMYPGFWPIESEAERTRALAAASDTSASLKAVKVFVMDGQTHASLELLLPDVEAFQTVFKRGLHALQGAVHRFAMQMQAPSALEAMLDAAQRAAHE